MIKLYQLHIDKEIVRDWCGGIFFSRLYHSVQECTNGCLNEEIFDIGEALWNNADFPANTEDMADIDCDDADELKAKYLAGDKAVVAYIDNVRKWLITDHNKSFYGDYSVVWNVLGFELVGKPS
jgi:hypothetical protein